MGGHVPIGTRILGVGLSVCVAAAFGLAILTLSTLPNGVVSAADASGMATLAVVAQGVLGAAAAMLLHARASSSRRAKLGLALAPALAASGLAFLGHLLGETFSGPVELLAFAVAFLAGGAVVWCVDALAATAPG